MKLPRLMNGWVTKDQKLHDTRDAAYDHELRQELTSVLEIHMQKKRGEASYRIGLFPHEIAELLLRDFKIEPKVLSE